MIRYGEVVNNYLEAQCLPDRSEKRLLPEHFIFDEEQSVKWNKEQVEQHNKLKREENRQLREARVKAFEEAFQLAAECLAQEYNISKAVGLKVFTFVRYEKEDMYQIDDILDYAEKLCQLFKED